jgi:pimeloyl-ACP methyl ester carboxylesterase
VPVAHRRVTVGDGTRLHVAEAGAGAPLVLLHGWPQHWWAWRHVIGPLAQEHRVLCPDLRGLGWSDAPPGSYTKEAWASDLLALLDALDLDRVATALAYQAALALPGAGERLLRHCPGFVRMLIRRGSHPAARWSRDELDAYAERLREPARARASSAVYRTFLTRELREMIRGRYAGSRLRVPVLMLTGAADPVTGPAVLRGLGAHADHARTEVVAGAGHFLRRGPRAARC